MPTLITQVSTAVIRDGKRKFPVIGKPFPYTDEEADYIRKQQPTGLRKPVNETLAVEPEEDDLEVDEDALDDELDGETADDEDADVPVKAGGEGTKPAPKKPAAKQNTGKKPARKATANKAPADDEDEDDDI